MTKEKRISREERKGKRKGKSGNDDKRTGRMSREERKGK